MSDDNELNIKELREETASGWMALSQQEGMEYVVDALLESPPEHTGKIERLSERTGLDESELREHLEFLEDLGAIELHDDEYTLHDDSIVMKELFHLNSALNKELGESE